MKRYRSKIGIEIIAPIIIIIVISGVLIGYENLLVAFIFVSILVSFIAHMIIHTYYEVGKDSIRIKCGFFYDKVVNINTIREIRKTNNPISSPAFSLDRILVDNGHDSIIISPNNKEEFINHLTEINPDIKVTLK